MGEEASFQDWERNRQRKKSAAASPHHGPTLWWRWDKNQSSMVVGRGRRGVLREEKTCGCLGGERG